ncbi:MAG TPA: ABC transporter permease [Gemmatimonadales bacterium]|nr:ABC transporter permease [Gemmatimonadales bacterium]
MLATILVLPVAALVLRVPPARLAARLAEPEILDALRLSLVTSVSAAALAVVLGLPVAYLLATRSFPGKRLVEAAIDLPMVLPPTVAGLALLLAFGRTGLAGRALEGLGITLPFTTVAVVLAQVFMAAPFFIGAARAGFAAVDRRLLDAAATLRASEIRIFFHVMLPLARPALLAGLAMALARALGEFGATITFAGNLPGVTQTMPLAVYLALQTDLEAAVTLAVLLLVISFGLLLTLRAAPAGRLRTRDADAPR